jgi:hypothetical protein
MIKLTQLISELGINNPNKTAEEVEKYYRENIYHNDNEFNVDGNGWKKYKEICKPYMEKYGMNYWLSTDSFYQLPQCDPNGLYKAENVSATWVMLIDPNTKSAKPTYIESEITVSQFKLPKNLCDSSTLPSDY